jgi:uncharacterized protein YjbJ (UPF0337 family)
MDWNRVEGNWKQVKGKVKEKWGKLTDDDLTAINGRRDQLEGKIQGATAMPKTKLARKLTIGTTLSSGNRQLLIQVPAPRGAGFLCAREDKPKGRIDFETSCGVVNYFS